MPASGKGRAREPRGRIHVSIPTIATVILITASSWFPALPSSVGFSAVAILKHSDMVLSVVFSPDGFRVLTAAGTDAHLWDAETGRHLAVLGPHGGWVTSAEFSPNGHLVATASVDKTVRLWEVESGRPAWPWFLHRETTKLFRTLSGHEAEVWKATFTPSGHGILTQSEDRTTHRRTLRIWSVATGEVIIGGKGGKGGSLAFSPNGHLVAISDCQEAYVLDLDKNRVKLSHKRDRDEGCMGTATFSLDSRRIAIEQGDEDVQLWEVDTGKRLAILDGEGALLLGTAFSPDGRRFATASFGKTARLWDHVGQLLSTLTGHRGSVGSVAFSPDSRRVVTASFDQTARLWDSDTGRPLAVLTGHTGEVRGAVFSPDGRLIATASSDRTARLWRLGP